MSMKTALWVLVLLLSVPVLSWGASNVAFLWEGYSNSIPNSNLTKWHFTVTFSIKVDTTKGQK